MSGTGLCVPLREPHGTSPMQTHSRLQPRSSQWRRPKPLSGSGASGFPVHFAPPQVTGFYLWLLLPWAPSASPCAQCLLSFVEMRFCHSWKNVSPSHRLSQPPSWVPSREQSQALPKCGSCQFLCVPPPRVISSMGRFELHLNCPEGQLQGRAGGLWGAAGQEGADSQLLTLMES